MADIREQLLAAFEVEHREHVSAIRRALADPASANVREMFRRAHSLKGAARAVDLPQIEELAHHLEDLLASVEDGAPLNSPTVDAIHLELDRIEVESASARENREAADAEPRHDVTPASLSPVQSAAANPSPSDLLVEGEAGFEFVRIDTGSLRQLSQSVHALTNNVRSQQGAPLELRRLLREAQRLQQLWRGLRVPRQGREGARAIDFESGLKTLVNSLAHLAQQQRRGGWRLETDLAVLQEQLDSITLTPAEAVFGDLGRMVRELARAAGIEVDVRVDGLEVKAERRVLQALRDPLIQLLRNAIRHGAEPIEARRAAGKPERLLVGLALEARAGQIQASVFDDGRGPDLQRLEAAARDKGLLLPGGADDPAPSAEEVLALAFEPGVSSAETVDRMAGRGMGMSIVLQALRGLGGSARLAQRRPYGAEVVLTAPLSTSRQTVVLVEAAGATFGLPSFGVQRLLRLQTAQLESVEGALVGRLLLGEREVLAPVVPLAGLLLTGPAQILASGDVVSAVLLARGDRYLAVAVDTLCEVREIGIEALGVEGLNAALHLGAGLVDDETPVTILSPDGLLDRWLRDERSLASAGLGLAAAPHQEPPRRRTVLVVDDSITTRTLEKSILEGQGYHVLLAVDGVDALHHLRAGEAIVDVVVADIEMPRMDGFSLLQAIKADASLSSLPVILMTSRSDPVDVRRGMELGAEAYITKQKFDQRELLATIGRIL